MISFDSRAGQLLKAPGFTTSQLLTSRSHRRETQPSSHRQRRNLKPVVPGPPAEIVNVFTARQGASKDYRHSRTPNTWRCARAPDVFADVSRAVLARG
jgi:hypothetical protein